LDEPPLLRLLELRFAAPAGSASDETVYVAGNIDRRDLFAELIAVASVVYDALYAYCQGMVRRGMPDGQFR
jgi:hypothetical protein